MLQSVLKSDTVLQYSEHILGKGVKFYEAAVKMGLEGIIAKDSHSVYESTRSHSWLKIKSHSRTEGVICGFTMPRRSRKHFASLILGVKEDGKWRYIGHVGGGFDQKKLSSIREQLEPLITDKSPFDVPPTTNTPVTWVKPKLSCDVTFAEWTSENIMRQPIFMNLHESSPANITNVDKLFFPKEGITKGDLVEYYRQMAPFILPYLKDRPIMLHRYPNGIEEEGFYQKNADAYTPSWVKTFPINHEDKTVNYLLIPDKKTLLFAINLGSIDLHPFNARIHDLDKPDYLVLDLDPQHLEFDKVIEVARCLHEILQKAGIANYCRTSGGRGLHVYIPLGAKYGYDQVKPFAELIATLAHEELPTFTSLVRLPSNRPKKVYIDYLQNSSMKGLVAPYCVRPRPGALVSAPLDWSEVKPGLDPADFTIKNIYKRVNKKGDLFHPVLGKGIDMRKALKNASFG